MAKNTKKDMWKRTMILTFILVVLGFGYAISFLYKWQIKRGDELKGAALDQSLVSTTLAASRGTIYDAGGKIMAQTASVWTVVLEPNYVDDEATRTLIADGMSKILDMKYEDVYNKLKEDSYYTYLKRKVETSVKDEIEKFLSDNDIGSGVRLIEDYKRYYPYGTTASVVLGFTGTDNNGLAGVELEYENELRGTAGRMVSAKNAIGTDMPFQYEQMVGAQDGYDLVLTIDETVQSTVEKYLDEGCEKYGVKNGAAAIMMDVNTGAIIALAVSGDFDPNDPFTVYDDKVVEEIEKLPKKKQDQAYSDALQKQWRNKAVSDTYVPGSVFKMVTASSALDSGTIKEDTTYECTGSYEPYPGVDKINCWVHPSFHGTETVREGICNSCNPFFMQVGQAMGPDVFYKYFEAFGLTDYTGIDLPGESSGISYDAEGLRPVELATESFGQGFTITPMQMITAGCAVANGGYLVQPHVVEKILDGQGNIVKTADSSYKRQVISEDVSEIMVDILKQNVSDPKASGRNGYVPGYSVGGKTGTSEKIAEWQAAIAAGKKDAVKEYIASFLGFVPADDPQYALLVFLDEPDRETASGGGMAAPVFSQIMSEVLPYLGVEKTSDEVSDSENVATAPEVVGMTVKEAKKVLEEAGFGYELYDEEMSDKETVNMQVPAAGENMPDDGSVMLYPSSGIPESDLVEIPKFVGYSVDDCNYLANISGVQIIFSGSYSDGMAQSQSIEEGKKVKPGTVVTVSFIDSGAASERT